MKNKIRKMILMLFAATILIPMFATLSACRTTTAGRQELRQETRVQERTEGRMERRRGD